MRLFAHSLWNRVGEDDDSVYQFEGIKLVGTIASYNALFVLSLVFFDAALLIVLALASFRLDCPRWQYIIGLSDHVGIGAATGLVFAVSLPPLAALSPFAQLMTLSESTIGQTCLSSSLHAVQCLDSPSAGSSGRTLRDVRVVVPKARYVPPRVLLHWMGAHRMGFLTEGAA